MIAAVRPEIVDIAILSYATADVETGNMAAQRMTNERRTNGAGFIVDASGIIATNRHTVARAHEIVVTLSDGTRLRASLLAAATQADLALLKVDAGRELAVARFGDSEAMQPGDRVFMVGNPLGLGGTVTSGIVSALDRNTDESQAVSFMQIDAPLNPGNSGGPVFNGAGEVIGVSTALFSPGGESAVSVGLGFAIPSNDANFIIRRLRQDGVLRLGWIGAHVTSVSIGVATALGLRAPSGSIITGIESGSPAAAAGLRNGDVILTIGDDVPAQPRILNRVIGSSPIGGAVNLAIWRDHRRQVVSVAIGESAADKTEAKPAPADLTERVDRDDFGLVLGPADSDVRARLALPGRQTGVLVTNVVPNSPAAKYDITPGAVILNVESEAVETPAEALRLLDAAIAEKREHVLLLIADTHGRRWISLPLKR